MLLEPSVASVCWHRAQVGGRFCCLLKRCVCTDSDCESCTQILAVTATTVQTIGPEGTAESVTSYDVPSSEVVAREQKRREVEHFLMPRRDLQRIETTLPKYRPGKHRKFQIESDGSIVYEQEEGEWEPPRDINGYQRDPENPWRFTPLWPKCMKRKPIGKRTKSCGCIQVEMKCVHFKSELIGESVTHKQCQQCPVREKGE